MGDYVGFCCLLLLGAWNVKWVPQISGCFDLVCYPPDVAIGAVGCFSHGSGHQTEQTGHFGTPRGFPEVLVLNRIKLGWELRDRRYLASEPCRAWHSWEENIPSAAGSCWWG